MTEEEQIGRERLVQQIQDRIRTEYGCPGAAEKTIDRFWDESGHGRSCSSTLHRICRWKKGDELNFRPGTLHKMARILEIPSEDNTGKSAAADVSTWSGASSTEAREKPAAGGVSADGAPVTYREGAIRQSIREDVIRQQVLEDVIDCMNQYELQESCDVLRQVAMGLRAVEKAAIEKGLQSGDSRTFHADRPSTVMPGIQAAAEQTIQYGSSLHKPTGERAQRGEPGAGNTPGGPEEGK